MSNNGGRREGIPPFGDEYSRLRKEEVDRRRRNTVFELFGYRPTSPVAAASAPAAAVPQPSPTTNTSVWHHGLTGQLSLSGDLQNKLQEQREREERFIARCHSLSKSRERFRYRTTNSTPSMATPMPPSSKSSTRTPFPAKEPCLEC